MKQIYPPTITGKGFAAGGSVLEHKFGASPPFTLGVEEEYMLLDPETFDLVQHVDTVLTAVENGEFIERIGPELMQSVVEISTPVCRTAGDVDAELRKFRSYVTGIAREQGLRVGSAGTHPFSLFERQRITARDRYRALGELAVLARGGDRARLEPANGLLRVPSLGPAAPLPRLRRLRRGRRPAGEDRLHRRLHAHLVGHPPAPALRHDRASRHGRRHPH